MDQNTDTCKMDYYPIPPELEFPHLIKSPEYRDPMILSIPNMVSYSNFESNNAIGINPNNF